MKPNFNDEGHCPPFCNVSCNRTVSFFNTLQVKKDNYTIEVNKPRVIAEGVYSILYNIFYYIVVYIVFTLYWPRTEGKIQ